MSFPIESDSREAGLVHETGLNVKGLGLGLRLGRSFGGEENRKERDVRLSDRIRTAEETRASKEATHRRRRKACLWLAAKPRLSKGV